MTHYVSMQQIRFVLSHSSIPHGRLTRHVHVPRLAQAPQARRYHLASGRVLHGTFAFQRHPGLCTSQQCLGHQEDDRQRLLGPPTEPAVGVDRVRSSNQAFWRQLVLTSFNFEVEPTNTFNVEDYCDESSVYYHEDSEVSAIVKEWERTHAGTRVDEYLLENLAYWQHLEVYFRPSQYGFLRAIQMGELLVDEWPAHEDAFTLFCDLSTLVDEFKAFENLYTFSDGDQFIYPCLLSELQKPLGPRNFELLEHCGIAPHFWEHEGPPVWRWAEFGGQVTCDGYIFPLCEDETLPALKALVATKMRDWRVVMVDIPDGEYAAAMFFLGTTKHSQRCLGYVGQRDYY